MISEQGETRGDSTFLKCTKNDWIFWTNSGGGEKQGGTQGEKSRIPIDCKNIYGRQTGMEIVRGISKFVGV